MCMCFLGTGLIKKNLKRRGGELHKSAITKAQSINTRSLNSWFNYLSKSQWKMCRFINQLSEVN